MSCHKVQNVHKDESLKLMILKQIYEGIDKTKKYPRVSCKLLFTDPNNFNTKIKISNQNWIDFGVGPNYSLLIPHQLQKQFQKLLEMSYQKFYQFFEDSVIKQVAFDNAKGWWIHVKDYDALYYIQ